MSENHKGSPLWQKGMKSPNPLGRPKKPKLPADVSEILSKASPAVMDLACREALGHPDKAGKPTQKPNIRVLTVLLDKLAPSLKAVGLKTDSQLPTMILVGSDTNPAVLNALKTKVEKLPHATLIEQEPEQEG